MSRYRLVPSPAQEAVLRHHCAHARYVWNLAVEQHRHRRPGRASAPRYLEQSRQLTEARAEHDWLPAGSQTVRQQALRDFAQAMAAFFDPGNPARRPSWRNAGRDEGFRVVGRGSQWDVRRVSRKVGQVWVPKAGWVRFRWSRAVPAGVKSYRVTKDIARRSDVIRVEDLHIVSMTRSAKGTVQDPGRNVRQKAGLNRGILRSGWGLLVRRLEEKAPGRVEKVSPVNAAINVAAGHPTHLPGPLHARRGCRDAGPVNREPQLLASLTGCE